MTRRKNGAATRSLPIAINGYLAGDGDELGMNRPHMRVVSGEAFKMDALLP
jgi:hypothetical protein